ncbi:MAG: HAD family phosphatase [Lachnospiraceae bacterium]|nr:HAD family phosphatase [Lachnospiraceae bacterium]
MRAAIIDIDGTLLDSMPLWMNLGQRYLESVGRTPDENLGTALFSMTIPEGIRYMKKTYDLTESEEDIRAGINDIIDHFYKMEVELKPGVRPFLEKMKEHDVPMVLATTNDRALATAALTRHGVLPYFKKMYVCEEMDTTKREPKVYLAAASELGCRPEEIVVFEDILRAVKTAHGAHFYTAAMADPVSADDTEELKATADWYFQDFDEAREYFFGKPSPSMP